MTAGTVAELATSSRSVRRWAVGSLVAAAAVALYAHAWGDTDVSLGALTGGTHSMWDIVHRSQPPARSVLDDSIRGAVVTFDTALLGTTVAFVGALLLTPLAARNTAPNRLVCEAARVVIGLARAIPSVVFALVFITAVGLGPFPAVCALAVHSIGTMGKLFAETVEDMDTGPVDALRVSGARPLQVFLHGVLPGIAPQVVSQSLYRLDNNVRDGLVMGFVGAGGIGFMIFDSINLFQYKQVTTELIVMLALLLGVERLSSLLRRRIA